MFPTDPSSPGGPDRSEYVRREYARDSRFRRGLRLLTLAAPRPPRTSSWPAVSQLTPLSSAPARDSGRSAA